MPRCRCISTLFLATPPCKQVSDLFGWINIRFGIHGRCYSSIFISPVAGWLCDRSGPKVPAVGGLVFSVPFLVLLQIPHASIDDQTGQVVILCVILALLGT